MSRSLSQLTPFHPSNYLGIHREDESFDLLDLCCLKTSCGAAEYGKCVLCGLASGVF